MTRRTPASKSGEVSAKRTSSSAATRRDLLRGLGGAAIATGFAGCLGNIGAGGDDAFTIGFNMELSQGYGLLGGSVVDAAQLRGNQINDNGGLGGRQIEYVVEDNQVNPSTAVEKARKLIRQDDVDIMFGPINSSQRIAIADIVEQEETPLIYPIPYEGTEAPDYCNEWIFKTWQVPPQQVIPLIPWLVERHGGRFYFLGADYTWPHALNNIGKRELDNLGGETVGESYVQVNSTDFSSIIPRIENADPDVLFMDLVGSSVGAVQKQLQNAGVRGQWKEVGLAHGPAVLEGVSPEATTGVLSSQGYYQTLQNEENQQFISDYEEEYGESAFINYLTGPAYIAMSLLERAVENAGGSTTEDLMEGLPGTSIDNTIGGPVSIEHDHQANVQCKIGEITEQKQYEVIDTLEAVMPPETCSGF